MIDLEVRAVDGPLFVAEEHRLEHDVLAVGQSRRVESHWVETRIVSVATGQHTATVAALGCVQGVVRRVPGRPALNPTRCGRTPYGLVHGHDGWHDDG